VKVTKQCAAAADGATPTSRGGGRKQHVRAPRRTHARSGGRPRSMCTCARTAWSRARREPTCLPCSDTAGQSRRRCGRREPSPGAHVGGVSPVPAQMWPGNSVPPQMWPPARRISGLLRSIASPSGESTGSAGNGCGLVLQSGICPRNGSPTRVEVHPSRRGCVSSTRKQASQGYAPAPAGYAAQSCWRSPLVGHTSTEMICSSRST
jgi:hypothetical protein